MKKHEDIRKLAYDLFERGGRVHGRDLEHWLEAERMIKVRQIEKHARDTEAAVPKQRAIQRSDARWHEARKTGKGESPK
jgi:hypothetical protein